MLRAITFPMFGLDAKFWGVVVMGAAIAIYLFCHGLIGRGPFNVTRAMKIMLVLFAIAFVMLGILGALPSTPVRTALAQLGTAIYFLFFLAMPWYTRWESTKPVPERVTK